MSQENLDLVQRTIDAYNRADLRAWEADSHPDVEVDWSASRGLEARVYRGHEETRAFFQGWFDLFERIEIKPEGFIESGDLVLVPNTAVLLGRDGIETVARSCLLYELRDGRVARICLYQETRDALEATGIKT